MSIKAKDHLLIPDEDLLVLDRLRVQGHDQCMAFLHPALKLDFRYESPKVLRAEVAFTNEMTSFNQMVHGGLQAFLIDQAMTCALMGLGIYGATCELKLRYRGSVRVAPLGVIRVWIEKRRRTLYDVEAELLQNEKVCTQATARFMKQVLEDGID